jgi:predicted dehydrogenase
MRGALVGFGTIALGHIAAYARMDDVAIEAVVEPVATRRRLARALVPGVRTYPTLAALFSGSEQPEFIDICSPPSFHAAHMRTALLHQCHVLCEKPFVLEPRDCKAVLALSRATGKIAYACHTYKFSPAARVLKRSASSGLLGRLKEGRVRVFRTRPAVGVSEWRANWRRDPRVAGGGILYDHGTHAIYLAHHLCARAPGRLRCRVARLRSTEHFDTEDTAFLTLDLGDIPWTISLTWAASARTTRVGLIGDRQSVVIENDEVHYLSRDGARVEPLSSGFDDSSHVEWFQDLFADFRNVVAEPERNSTVLHEALMTALVLQTAYISAARQGESMPVPTVEDYLSRESG